LFVILARGLVAKRGFTHEHNSTLPFFPTHILYVEGQHGWA
jgi:hypothetical protein